MIRSSKISFPVRYKNEVIYVTKDHNFIQWTNSTPPLEKRWWLLSWEFQILKWKGKHRYRLSHNFCYRTDGYEFLKGTGELDNCLAVRELKTENFFGGSVEESNYKSEERKGDIFDLLHTKEPLFDLPTTESVTFKSLLTLKNSLSQPSQP